MEWWSGFAQIVGFVDAVPPPWLLWSGFVSLVVAGLILAVATLRTRSLWLAIGLHGGWIFCPANSSIAGEVSGEATGRSSGLGSAQMSSAEQCRPASFHSGPSS